MSKKTENPTISSTLLPSSPVYAPLLNEADARGHGNATRGAGAGAAAGACIGSFSGPVGVGIGALLGGLAGFYTGQSLDDD